MEAMRLDKWLWAARLYKTRSLAARAILGGKVHRNGQRTKPARPVAPGDRISLTRGEQELTIIVRALSDRRGPASAAAQLYEETPESRAQRERAAAEKRQAAAPGPTFPRGRPAKRDRRLLRQLKGRL